MRLVVLMAKEDRQGFRNNDHGLFIHALLQTILKTCYDCCNSLESYPQYMEAVCIIMNMYSFHSTSVKKV